MNGPYQQQRPFPVKPPMGMERKLGLISSVAVTGLSLVVLVFAILALVAVSDPFFLGVNILLTLATLVTLAGGAVTFTRSWRIGDRMIRAGVVVAISAAWGSADDGYEIFGIEGWAVWCVVAQCLILVIAVVGMVPITARFVGRAPWQAVVDSWAQPGSR